MARKPHDFENTCSYCLYFIPPPASHYNGRGNCSLHKQWIDSATRTTCSDMSNRRLAKGIYQILRQSTGQWLYILRTQPMRTRLFLLSGSGAGEKRDRRAPKSGRIRAANEKLT